MVKFVIIALACISSLALGDEEWCGLENCEGRVHVDCEMGNGKMGDACPSGAVMLNLQPVIDVILNEFNTFRNTVAGGRLPNFWAATRMGTMKWNVRLANLARRNVKKCDFTQDECANTPDINYVGQNIARAVYKSSDTRTNIAIIKELIQLWFNEYKQATVKDIRQFPIPTDDSPVIANFCQSVRDYATRIGCGALKHTVGTTTTLLFTCNFDLANVANWPVYDDGPNRKKCKTGNNPAYPYLCSPDEEYDVNGFAEDGHYV